MIIPSHDFSLAEKAKESLGGFDIQVFDGRGYPSFSKLMNDCIVSAEHETVLILNHKLRANALHVYKMIELIRQGYGLVALCNFHFFGFKKDLFRKIGMWDERFVGGEYEDSDVVRRMIEADIGIYMTKEVPEIYIRSGWDNTLTRKFFYEKWPGGGVERALPEPELPYDLGPYQGSGFLTLKQSHVKNGTDERFFEPFLR